VLVRRFGFKINKRRNNGFEGTLNMGLLMDSVLEAMDLELLSMVLMRGICDVAK